MDFNCIVIGGGIVGLAATDHISANTDNVALFERNSTVGFETSSRNSEVIHAGLYYGKDSKKARMCVEGRREIYRLAQEHGIPAHKCGKIIVSTNPQESEQLQSLLEKGRENEVEGLQMLTGAQVRKREPHVSAIEGLLSPESGIVDSHALMTHYRRRAEEQGAFVVVNCTVTALEKLADGWKVTYHDSDGVDSTTAATVVNAAGLGAQDVMRMASFDPDQHDLTLHLCKGEYFTVKPSKADKVKCLVYPVPKPNLKSLGIHTVVDMSGMFKLWAERVLR
ncbi:MAG: NAD(P)/FAD-dependent oxidoreductase [Planctomycetota bacterium]|nr:NAD(P)/FAD-dependent oxidoreductase [Planctomycetota bacterium]